MISEKGGWGYSGFLILSDKGEGGQANFFLQGKERVRQFLILADKGGGGSGSPNFWLT